MSTENKDLSLEEQIAQLKAQQEQDRKDKEALQSQLEQEREEKKELESLNQEQAEALSLAEAQKGNPLPVVAYKKEKYQVMAAKFQHPKQTGKTEKIVTAQELTKDKDLIQYLVEGGSGILQKIVEPSK